MRVELTGPPPCLFRALRPCNRHRARRSQPLFRQGGRAQCFLSTPCPWVSPVSYTHLTLPTICSV
eukprot:9485468-Prorocentrum_lima.AAC.1